jgi:hypothetical protein
MVVYKDDFQLMIKYLSCKTSGFMQVGDVLFIMAPVCRCTKALAFHAIPQTERNVYYN